MIHAHEKPERVLVLVPTQADAALTLSVLGAAGLECLLCTDHCHLGDELSRGAGAVLVTEEIITSREAKELHRAIAAQPPWSDLPVLVLSAAGRPGAGRSAQRHPGGAASANRQPGERAAYRHPFTPPPV